MNLTDLQALGAFVSAKTVKRTIEVNRPLTKPPEEWDDPEVPEFTGETESVTLDIFVKRPSSADEFAIGQAQVADQMFVSVCRLVRNQDGSPLFESLEQASQLASWVLIPVITELEKFIGTRPKKTLPPATSSGSKSRSRSGDEAQKSGRNPSARSGATS